MRNTIKAVLLSALVFPGTGHFSLKKPVHGTVLVVITFICLYVLFSTAMDITKELSGKIQGGEIPYDTEVVRDLVTEKLSAGEYQYVSFSVIGLMACWIFGIVDSFRIGQSRDKESVNQKPF